MLLMDFLLAQNVVVKQQGDRDFLWIEAEAGEINAPMMVHAAGEASGGQYIEVRGGNNNIINAPQDGHTIYRFNISNAGTYKIWGRVKIDMDDEDAFWIKMDDNDWIIWQDIEVGCKWHWDEVHDYRNNNKVMTYYLEAGTHTLILTYGMDQARLDKLLITNDMEYRPTGKGPGAEAAFLTGPKMPLVNESLRFDASASTSTEGSIVSYNWDFGDGKKATGVTPNHVYSAAGNYPVQLIIGDDTGLTGRLTKTVTVYTEEPVVHFEYAPDRSKPEELVTFDGSASFHPNGKIISYDWDFGDGLTYEGLVVKHAFEKPGEYVVTLRVTDSEEKRVCKTRLVTVITGVPKKIIYETDMCLDVDDAGALAMLHGLANNDEAELLAVCYNEVHPAAASAIDAINTWYGRGDIPVGIYKKNLPDPDPSVYLDALTKYPHDLDGKSAPSALDVYTNVLSNQPDTSVTIISVGFINNLYDILKAEPDLVARKVKELVIMGSIHGGGFNLARHNTADAADFLIRNWPSPLVFSQPGTGILTGEGFENLPEENPVREAYFHFFYGNFCGRHSWDQMAVLYGVRGISDYFSDLINVEKWQMPTGQRTYFKTRLSNDSYARIIENLMLEPPIK
jgi:PKD repeat protein